MALRTYGKLEYGKDQNGINVWIIEYAEPHVCIKLKAIFPKLPINQTKRYHFKDIPEVCTDLLWFIDRYPLSITDTDLFRLKRMRKKYDKNINDLESIMLPEYIPEGIYLRDGYLGRDYQLKGCEIYIKRKRLLIGDQVGLGKTLIGILSFIKKGTLPAVVAVQTHLTTQWKAEIERFTSLSVHVIKGTSPYNLPKADVYIIKYSCLSGWVDIFEKKLFKSAVFDEAQELRHDTSQKYGAAQVLSQSVEYCLGLTATPIYNYGNEIYNVIDLINPGCLGNRNDFYREWLDAWGVKVKDPAALGTYLREEFYFVRRTREDVGRELPQINTIVHTVGYNQSEVKTAERLAEQLAIKVTSGSFMERGQAARELDILMRHTTGVSKAREVAQFVKIMLENNEPILLVGWHRDVYDIWLEELAEYNPVLYTGSESGPQKEQSKLKFTSGDTSLMIISLRSGIGLDGLQHCCKTVVFGELDWSPKVHEQVIGRVDRDGQKDQTTIIYLVSDFGSDPLIIDMLGVKSSQSHNIVDPLKAIDNQHSDNSRIKILADQYLKKTASTKQLEKQS